MEQASPQFFRGWTLGHACDLAHEVVRQGESFQRGAGFEFSVEFVRHVSDLDHSRHVDTICSCSSHVKGAGAVATWPRPSGAGFEPDVGARQTTCRPQSTRPEGVVGRVRAVLPRGVTAGLQLRYTRWP